MLTDVRIHEAVEYLLSYLPPSLRLVIAARFDPPLPLARMRARGEMTEIRAADLRFSATEAAGLVSAVGQVEVGSDAVDALVDRTEGWAVGLKLAALTMRGSPDPTARATAVRGDDRHIIDFLSSEVLDRLPADRREFLVRTAVLDRLCGSLCDAVLGRTGSAAVLEALERTDLFVVPLDAHREWYRYHRLFRDVLTRELETTSPETVPELLRRAADWYLAAGQVDEAIRLLTTAGDQVQAGQLLLSAEDLLLEQGAAATYLRLCDQLGTATIREDPRLAVSMAGAAVQSGQLDRVPALLDIAEAKLGDANPPYQGWRSVASAAAMLRAAFDPVVRADPPLMLAYAERAAGLETDPTLQGYVVTRITLGAVLSGLDRREEAIPVLAEAWERSAKVEVPSSSACRRPVCWHVPARNRPAGRGTAAGASGCSRRARDAGRSGGCGRCSRHLPGCRRRPAGVPRRPRRRRPAPAHQGGRARAYRRPPQPAGLRADRAGRRGPGRRRQSGQVRSRRSQGDG